MNLLSAAALWTRFHRFFRLWLVVACVWWAYLAWGYWSYKLPEIDPKPVEVSSSPGIDFSALADLPTDYFSPEQTAYRARLSAYRERREVREKLFRFSLPVSIPLALWGLAALLVLIGGWTVSTRPKE